MQNIACELEESSKELINIYRGTLATGHQQRRPIFQTGTHINTSLVLITRSNMYYYHYLLLITITTHYRPE